MRRVGRIAASALFWTALSGIALALSANAHLQSPEGREVLRAWLSEFVTEQVQGQLQIEEVEYFSLSRVVLRNTRVIDPAGESVIEVERLVIGLDLAALADDELHFTYAHATGTHVRLIEGEDDTPTFIHAFQPTTPLDPNVEPAMRTRVEGLFVEGALVEGDVMGVRGLRLEDVDIQWRIDAYHEAVYTFHTATGVLRAPYPFEANLSALRAVISSDPRVGTSLNAQLDIGEESVRVRLGFATPPEETDDMASELDILLHPSPLNAERLEEVGLTWAEPLRGQIDGHIRFVGPPGELAMRAYIDTAGGPIAIRGQLEEGGYDITGQARDLQLQPLLRSDVDMQVGGTVRIFTEGDATDGSLPQLHAQVDPLQYSGFTIPSLHLEAALDEGSLIIHRVTTPHMDGSITARGRVGFDGDLDLEVDAHIRNIGQDPNLQRLMPGARGQLTTDVRLQYTAGDSPRINCVGRAQVSGLRYAGVTAGNINAHGSIRGPTQGPSIDLEGDVVGLRYATVNLGTGSIEISGSGRAYEAALDVSPHPGQRLMARGHAARIRDRWRVDSDELTFSVGDARWTGLLQGLEFGSGARVSVGQFSAGHSTERLSASGHYDPRRGHELEIRANDVDLGPMVRFFTGSPAEIDGNFTGEFHIGGNGASPTYELVASLSGAQVAGVPGIAARAEAQYADAQWRAQANARVGGQGVINLELVAATEVPTPTTMRSLRNVDLNATMNIEEIELGLIEPLMDEAPPLRGRASGNIHAQGQFGNLEVGTALQLTNLVYAEYPPLSVQVDGTYTERMSDHGDHDLSAVIEVEDSHGPLLQVDTRMMAAITDWLLEDEATTEALELELRRLSFLHPPRRVSTLPAPLIEGLPEVLLDTESVASGNIRQEGEDLVGSAQLGITWAGDPSALPCGGGNVPQATVRATIRGGQSQLDIRGRAGTHEVVHATVQAATPIEEWVRQASLGPLPPTQIEAQLLGFPLDQVPVACEYVEGPVQAQLAITDLFSESPQASLGVASQDFRVRRVIGDSNQGQVVLATPLLNLGLAVEAADGHTSLEASAHAGVDQHLDIALEFPINWDREHITPVIADEGDIAGDLDFIQAPLALALAAIPDVSSITGFIDGRLQIAGTVTAPRFDGELSVEDGSLTLQAMSQTLEEIQAEFEFQQDRIRIATLQARDDSGTSSARGTLSLEGWGPRRAELELETDEFPVRQEGSLVATISAAANIEADIGDDGMDANVVLERMSVRLPDQGARTLQSLTPHPDVVIIGEEPAEAPAAEDAYPIRVALESATPFWVRRNDFSALVHTDLNMTYRSPDLLVSGYANIQRGTFDVIGKEFQVREGTIGFDGLPELNPEVELSAEHDVRGFENDNVKVVLNVTGRLATPNVSFSAENMACADRGQIVALLVSGTACSDDLGPSNDDDARTIGAQAAGFISGVATGLGTLWAREQLGSRLPVISIEALNNDFTSARVRAGYQLDEFIPEALRRVVRGIYIEGSVSVSRDDAGGESRSQSVGFLLRLQFPHNIVGEVAGYPTNDSWRVDMTWEP